MVYFRGKPLKYSVLQKLAKLTNSHEINDYFHDKLYDRLDRFPSEDQDKMISEAVVLTSVGVKSEEDHKIIAYIRQHIRCVAEDISGLKLSPELLAKISKNIFGYRDQQPLNTVAKFYQTVAKELCKLGLRKQSYPNRDDGQLTQSPHNLDKWMSSMKDMYYTIHEGLSFKQAFDSVTNDWEKMEKNDFENWLSFYQQGTQNKYKTAQKANIPHNNLVARLPGMPSIDRYESKKKMDDDLSKLKDLKKNEESTARKEDLRSKIISRLNAAEKLVSNPSIQKDLNSAIDMDLSKWLETLHYLKRIIQISNVKSASSPILLDLVVKQGNQLNAEGYPKAGFFLKKLAQEIKQKPAAVPQAPPLSPSKESKLDEAPPAPTEVPEAVLAPIEDEGAAMEDFVKKMNNEFTEDEADIDDIDDEVITVTAQALPEFPLEEEPIIEVGEDPPPPPQPLPEPETNPSDISEVLKNVTLPKVIDRLEVVADILRKRDIPRELSVVDLMLNELNMSGFFPALAESQKSALDSNQYMTSRVDEVLSKLRSSIQVVSPIDLETEHKKDNPILEQVRDNLEKSEEIERAKQDKRKADRQAKEMEELEQEQAVQDLGAPVEIKQSPSRVM